MINQLDQPFSLKERFSRRFKVQMEESFAHESAEVRNPARRWYEQIPTRCGGCIMLFAETPEAVLEFYSPTARPTAIKIFERFKDSHPSMKIDTHFSGHEVRLLFPASILPKVANLTGAKRRRQLSPEQKARLAEVGAAHRFKSGNHGVQAGVTLQDGQL